MPRIGRRITPQQRLGDSDLVRRVAVRWSVRATRVLESEVEVQHRADGTHLPVVVAARVVLVVEVALELDVAVEGKRGSADPFRPAPRVESTVVEQLTADVGIHPYRTNRQLLLDRQ